MRHRTACAVVVAALLALPSVAAAAPPGNDDVADAVELPLNEFRSANNSDATIEADEPLTENDAGANNTCTEAGTAGPDAVQMSRTIWYGFEGTGGEIAVTSFNSEFDTVLAVYDTEDDSLVGCNDDELLPSGAFVSSGSRVVVPSEEGHVYAVQLGGNAGVSGTVGEAHVIATDGAPGNDDRAAAEDITSATGPLITTNVGATVEPGEDVLCEGPDSHVGSTIWFKYVAPAPGTATFTSTGFDTLIQVYRGNEAAPLACNDDGIPGQSGPSRVSLPVSAGTYLVQVGGFEAANDFNLTVSAEFARNLDVDGDGSTVPGDCDDGDPALHPGAPDPRGDGIDQNCDGPDGLAADRDGDGSLVPADCKDDDPKVHPGARDIPGDRIDQDCKNGDAKPKPVPFTYDYDISPAGRVNLLKVKAAKGAKVTVSCRGRGCPGRISFKSKGRVRKLTGRFSRKLGSGATITIRTAKKHFQGREVKITYFDDKPVRKRVRCLAPGKLKTQKCRS